MSKQIVAKLLFLIPIIVLTSMFSGKKKELIIQETDPPFINYSSQWVDSKMNSMSLDEKIGQLFMVAVYPNQKNQSSVENLISNYNIGGIIYFKGNPTRVAELTNIFQVQSKTPLMVAIDGEWGVGMRIDSVLDYPHQMMLGAIEDNKIIYQMGAEIANQCKTLGVNINFAPVVDINNNANNPVIGVRSFGENKISVAQKGYAYALGLQDNKVLAVAKHFPGHGDTDVDSHKDLPIINVSKARLDSLELFPFKHLIKAGIGGIMTAHLYIPALDKTPHLPSTLSRKIVNNLLIKKLKFKGLIFTDALGMQGVAKYYGAGEAEIKALLAGNDVLLMSQNVPVAFKKIKAAVLSGKISEDLINEKVEKILKAKYWFGVSDYKKVDTKNVVKNLNTSNSKRIKRELVENALTLVKNDNELLPFENLKDSKFACVSIGNGNPTVFQDYLSRYTKIDNFHINKSSSITDFASLRNKLKNYDYIIVGIHNTRQYAVKTYGITRASINFVENLAQTNSVILDVFGSPYALNRFTKLNKLRSVIVSYEDDAITQELSAQLIFGGIPAKGHLPVSINNYAKGTGETTAQMRLKYSIPEELNINPDRLKIIDTIVYAAIGEKAFPGCQVMAIKNGTVFFQKSYGYQTYKFQ
ncbi:MAG: glycoside hydrolase family 3 N-terminal domain-containing protein, partial [Bacteroidota bacterium]|nr:glycoside hydrolase family 3 N-terminal domain-containing protein [Bacteroidota bacterium]